MAFEVIRKPLPVFIHRVHLCSMLLALWFLVKATRELSCISWFTAEHAAQCTADNLQAAHDVLLLYSYISIVDLPIFFPYYPRGMWSLNCVRECSFATLAALLTRAQQIMSSASSCCEWWRTRTC